MSLLPYVQLMRLDKPVGIFLLWFPTAWALWIAYQGMPPFSIWIYFLLGTVVMRSAGCVANDLADRHFDKHVQRTQYRPLTSGNISVEKACILLLVLLVSACYIVLQLPILCFIESFLALFLTLIYPFFKRFFHAPQFILGLTFSMGIPMAFAATGIVWNEVSLLLYLLNVGWIISYDTMYAMADREDDLKIGIKSTALLFGRYDRLLIFLFQIGFHSCWIMIATVRHVSVLFYLAWGIGTGILLYQQKLLWHRDPQSCFNAFLSNSWYGAVMWLGIST